MSSDAMLKLMQIDVPTLFVCDDDGRLRYIREPGYAEADLDPAPRFFMGRTAAGNVWRFRHDLPQDLVDQLERLCRAEPVAADLSGPAASGPAIRAALQEHAPITADEAGPAYLIAEDVEPAVEVVLIRESDAPLMAANFSWTIRSPFGLTTGPITAVVVEGSAVSICYCARFTDSAAEAGVQTVDAFRGRGYASAVVAAWARAIRGRGRLPLYSTGWDNLASQGVARKLKMLRYGEHWSIT